MVRRGGEFRRLGAVGLQAAGVPARRAHDIEIARAWATVAGEAMTRRVQLVELKRGVMWLVAVDRSWLAAVRPHVPRMARELARTFPQLGIKKIRVRLAGSDGAVPIDVDVTAGEESGTRTR